MMVNLMIIGAMKCGTTSLSRVLNNHSKISVARNKEPHFFSQNPDWRNCIKDYHDLYDPSKEIWCDASTTYTCLPEFRPNIWKDLREYNPNLKFIYLVRNPKERLVSNYMHLYERGFTNLSITDAIKNETSLINRGRYYTQILPYYQTFGSENILILSFEKYKEDPKFVLNQVSDFLNISSEKFGEETVHANKSIGASKRHYHKDNLEKKIFYRTLKKISPSIHKSILRKKLSNESRSFKVKPEIHVEMVSTVDYLYKAELEAFSTLTGFDISEWH